MIISQTPLRTSFAGGGTDLAEYYRERDGYVVSAAIDKYVFVIVKERYDDKIYVNYTKKEIVDSVDEIQHELVREAMRITGVEKAVEITMLADIPSEGSGLGSSSSLTVGLLNALYMHQGVQVTAETLAEQACEIEIERCGKPIGKQDQYIAAYGGVCAFTFRADGTVEIERIPLEDADARRLSQQLLLFYTNKTRKSVHILEEQRERTPERMDLLDGIRGLAYEVRDLLASREYEQLGDVLGRNWEYKQQLASRITNGDIDELYDLAREGGMTGGKISGAGGGGFLLSHCPLERQERLRGVLNEYRELPFLLSRDGSKIIFNFRGGYGWR